MIERRVPGEVGCRTRGVKDEQTSLRQYVPPPFCAHAGNQVQETPRLQDWELFIRISKSYEFKFIDEPLVISYFTANSISANQDAFVKAHRLILEKHFQDFRRNRRLLASWHYSIGNLLCQSGKMEQGRNHILSAVKSYPLNIKYPVAAFISFLGKSAYVKVVRLKRRL